ncbi:hypothetical protein H1R20_g9799, partial [Candolleomyces eurysporus]
MARGGAQGSRAGSEAEGPTAPRRPVKSMPAAYSGKHPNYDSKDPSTATRFFDGVALAAETAGLKGHDEEIVKNALSYLDSQTARKWGLLKGGHDPYDFELWRKSVMQILPKSSRYDLGSMARLEDICRDAKKRPIGRDEKAAYYEFALGFKAEADPLLESGIIANRDLVVKFLGGLKPSFRDALNERLSRQGPPEGAEEAPRDKEDPYTLDVVISTATAMVDVAAVGPFGAVASAEEDAEYLRSSTSRGSTDRKDPDGLKDLKVKQESMTEDMARVFTTLDQVAKSVTKLTTQFDTFSTTIKATSNGASVGTPNRYPPPAAGQRPGMYPRPAGATFNCWYCGQPTHTISQCPQVRIDIEKGRITQRGSTIYCKGTMMTRESPDNATMKDRVDKAWKAPTQADLNLLEEYPATEEEAFEVLYQHQEEQVAHSVLNQSLDQMRRDQQSFLNKLVNQLKPAQQGAAPVAEVQREPTTREVFEQLVGLSKRLESMEQNQLQTRRAAAANQEDF